MLKRGTLRLTKRIVERLKAEGIRTYFASTHPDAALFRMRVGRLATSEA